MSKILDYTVGFMMLAIFAFGLFGVVFYIRWNFSTRHWRKIGDDIF